MRSILYIIYASHALIATSYRFVPRERIDEQDVRHIADVTVVSSHDVTPTSTDVTPTSTEQYPVMKVNEILMLL